MYPECLFYCMHGCVCLSPVIVFRGLKSRVLNVQLLVFPEFMCLIFRIVHDNLKLRVKNPVIPVNVITTTVLLVLFSVFFCGLFYSAVNI